MGLDMYLYKCGHLDEDSLKKMEGQKYDTINANCVLIREKDAEDTAMYGDLLPFMDSINVQFEYLDEVKLRKDFNIPENAAITGLFSDGKEEKYSFEGGKSITLPRSELESKYKYYQLEKAYICSCEEVAYWRKEYDISDEFNNRHKVENCGFYLTSYDELEDMDELFSCFPHGIPVARNQNEGIFYHEWY